MDVLLAVAVFIAAVAAAVIGIPRMMAAQRAHQREEHEAGSRGVAGFGVVDELFNPSARNAVFERQVQQEHVVPAPSPGDPAYTENRIRLTLPPEDGSPRRDQGRV
ncbi:hypothetical protein ACFJGV_04015 [Cnuibacter sp. UC19_7]|uniref:hypothetical protein n=1 Tax=Cnuibacter sp. UC19_7 TaxID=3350166 RepID=UPI00366D53E9